MTSSAEFALIPGYLRAADRAGAVARTLRADAAAEPDPIRRAERSGGAETMEAFATALIEEAERIRETRPKLEVVT